MPIRARVAAFWDLFEHDDGGWLQDVVLLDRLVTEKLKAEAGRCCRRLEVDLGRRRFPVTPRPTTNRRRKPVDLSPENPEPPSI